jgi:hypothetical protein
MVGMIPGVSSNMGRGRRRSSARIAAACLSATLLWFSVAAAGPAIIPFKEIRAGMKGTGKTVFKGMAVEEFDVEIIGTMENIAPHKNLILARLAGGPLQDTGIMEGMSGSPVFINDRLAGAVAYSWGFSKEPICGITPIEEMLEILDRGLELSNDVSRSDQIPRPSGEPAPASLLAWPDRMVSFLKTRFSRLGGAAPRLSAGSLLPMHPSVALSGYTAEMAREWFPAFEAMSLGPGMAGAPTGTTGVVGPPLSAGSAFGVTLVRGDLDITAIGTVTYVDGDRVLGLGHPFFSLGPTAMPMTRAYVYGHFPSLASSFKLAGPKEEIGSISQDRFAGVAGRIGALVKMVPVRVEMKRRDGPSRSYRFDIVPDPLLTPGLLNISLLSLLSSEEKDAGEITLRLREGSRIQVAEGLDVKLDNMFSGDLSALYASGTVAYMTYLLMNNEDRPSRIDGINLLFDYEDVRRTARIERIWLDRYACRPGETLALHVDLRPFRSDLLRVEIPLKIPEEAPEGKALLQVGDSLTLSRMESVAGAPYFVPRSLEHLVWLLNHIRLNHKVYATLIRPDNGAFISGQRLPNLPPSVASVILRPRGEQDISSRVPFRVLGEAEAETTHVVHGYQKAIIEVRR